MANTTSPDQQSYFDNLSKHAFRAHVAKLRKRHGVPAEVKIKRKAFESLEDLEDWQDQQAADLNSTDEELDFVIREGGHIMADMLDLDNRMASILDPQQFAAQSPAAAVTR